jgi:hypothetical protein
MSISKENQGVHCNNIPRYTKELVKEALATLVHEFIAARVD